MKDLEILDKNKLGDYIKYVWPHGKLVNLGFYGAWIILLVSLFVYASRWPYIVMGFFPLAALLCGVGIVNERRVNRNATKYLEALSERMMMQKSDLVDCLDSFIENHFG